ncbi:MAG: type II toxin-antitoxin system HipA family toxin [Anaerolineales bacterium]
MDPVDTVFVTLWDIPVGAVSWDPGGGFATFEFETSFIRHELDIAPLMMPLDEALSGITQYDFRTLPRRTYMGLPGMLADALPDRFGNQVINAWLARQGRTPESFNPVERLCYTGRRAMGALEFTPILNRSLEESVPVEISELVQLAQSVVNARANLRGELDDGTSDALLDILRVGTSAGGNRPKAIIALNDETSEIRSGQVDAPDGFDYWVLKFDGVKDNALGDPAGYGRIEYAYYLMAIDIGISMSECRLFTENGRAHFMTKRFDRQAETGRLHLQSLCAIAHYDFNSPGTYSYEQAFQVNRELKLPYSDMEQLYRRMLLNVIARNQDDHTKSIAYLMDREGEWRLSPAFDVIYSYNPQGAWTKNHQMSINGKTKDFSKNDLLQVASEMGIRHGARILNQVIEVVSGWRQYAEAAGVDESQAKAIGSFLRLFED